MTATGADAMGAPTRRAFLMAVSAALLIPAPGAAPAQEAGTLRLVVPAEPGGGWDRLAQVIATVMPEVGAYARVQVEYQPGAGGALALPRFVRGRRGQPDLLLVGGLTLVSSPIVNEGAVTVLDTDPIARLEGEPLVVAVAAGSPLRDAADLARTLRADPSGAQVAGGSEGSADHMLLATIGQALGVDAYALSYLPFSGGASAARAVLDGRARAGISNWSEFAPEIEAGRMRALALSGEARLPGLDVPTLREGGIDAVLTTWNGVFAPPGLDADARARLERAVEAMVRSPAWARESAARRWQDRYLPRAEFEPFLAAETRSVEAVLARLGLTIPRRAE